MAAASVTRTISSASRLPPWPTLRSWHRPVARSAAEVAPAGEDHGHVVPVGDLDGHLVAARAARLDDGRDAALGGQLDGVGEREVGVRGEARSAWPARPPGGARSRPPPGGWPGRRRRRRAPRCGPARPRCWSRGGRRARRTAGRSAPRASAGGWSRRCSSARVDAAAIARLDEQATVDALDSRGRRCRSRTGRPSGVAGMVSTASSGFWARMRRAASSIAGRHDRLVGVGHDARSAVASSTSRLTPTTAPKALTGSLSSARW